MEKTNLSPKKAKPANLIPARDCRAARPDLIDLTGYYTNALDDNWLEEKFSNDLSALPKGIQAFAKATFDIRGLIQLASLKSLQATGIEFPQAVNGIQVNLQAGKLHFLQGAAWYVDIDKQIGKYVIYYQDGQVRTIPIIYGRSLLDWWIPSSGQVSPTDAVIVWIGQNEGSRQEGRLIQVFDFAVDNPIPEVAIDRIDFVSDMTNSAPFLIAMSVEAGSNPAEA